MDIERRFQTRTATIAASLALSSAIYTGPFSGGTISLPAGWTSADLGFQVCDTPNGTYTPLYNAAGNLVTITASADHAYPLPDELFGAHYVKLWSQSAGVDAAQAAERVITVHLKA